jgi:hypothetical protein
MEYTYIGIEHLIAICWVVFAKRQVIHMLRRGIIVACDSNDAHGWRAVMVLAVLH